MRANRGLLQQSLGLGCVFLLCALLADGFA